MTEIFSELVKKLEKKILKKKRRTTVKLIRRKHASKQ